MAIFIGGSSMFLRSRVAVRNQDFYLRSVSVNHSSEDVREVLGYNEPRVQAERLELET